MEAQQSTLSRPPPPPAYDEATVYPSVFPPVPTHRVVLERRENTHDPVSEHFVAPSAPRSFQAPAAEEPVAAAAASSEELSLLVDMGIDREWAALALKRCSHNISDAAMFCLENIEQKDSMLLEESIALRRSLAVDAAAAIRRPEEFEVSDEPTILATAMPSPSPSNEPDASKGPPSRFKKMFPWMKRSRNDANLEPRRDIDGPIFVETSSADEPSTDAVIQTETDSRRNADAGSADLVLVRREATRWDDDEETGDGIFDPVSSLSISAIDHPSCADINAAAFESPQSACPLRSGELADRSSDVVPDALSLDVLVDMDTFSSSACANESHSFASGTILQPEGTSEQRTSTEQGIAPALLARYCHPNDSTAVEDPVINFHETNIFLSSPVAPCADSETERTTARIYDNGSFPAPQSCLLDNEAENSAEIATSNSESENNDADRVQENDIACLSAVSTYRTDDEIFGPTQTAASPVVDNEIEAAATRNTDPLDSAALGHVESRGDTLNNFPSMPASETAAVSVAAMASPAMTVVSGETADPFESSTPAGHLGSWGGVTSASTTGCGSIDPTRSLGPSNILDEEIPSVVDQAIAVTVRAPLNSLPRAMTVTGGQRIYRIEGSDVMTADAVEGQRESEAEYIPLVDAMVSIGDTINVPPEVSGAYVTDGSELFMTIAAPIGHEEEDGDTPAIVSEPMPTRSQPRGIRNYMFGSDRPEGPNNRASGIRRRQHLEASFLLDQNDSNIIDRVVLNLKQPKLGPGKKSPQGHRPSQVGLKYRGLSLRQAKCLAEANAPPIWSGDGDPLECHLCQRSHGVFRPLHHCRNCGYYVCDNCSDKYWPSSMIPECYHYQETLVRTCDSCNVLMESFNDALRRGDAQTAFSAYSSGNVNIHCPLTVYKSEEYPIHCAVRGGNLKLVRWLLETKCATVSKLLPNGQSAPLLTTKGISCLGIAAYYGHADIMRYLVQKRGCSLMEINDTDVLRRGLHAALEAPGPLPLVAGKGVWFQKKAVPHKDASQDELDMSSSDGPSPAPTAAAPIGPAVRGHLVTGNPRYENAIVATSCAVPEEPPPPLSMQTTSRPKQQYFRHKPVNNTIMQNTLLALQEASNRNRRASFSQNILRTSTPNVLSPGHSPTRGEVSVALGGVSGAHSSDHNTRSPLGVPRTPPVATDAASLSSSNDISEIDFSQSEDSVMQQILSQEQQHEGDDLFERSRSAHASPQQRVRDITDSYIVPYSDEDIISMSTHRK